MLTAGNTAHLLELKGITKRFPGVLALSDVSFSVSQAEVVALIGENGAGKSTLMKTLGGVHQPDEGEIFFDGKKVTIAKVADAIALGIGFVHQELNVLDNLDVAANIFMGREPLMGGPLRLVNQRKMWADSETYLKRLGLVISPRKALNELSIAQQQMVEIAKALSQNARVIIMDEPTSSLTLIGDRPVAGDHQRPARLGCQRDLHLAPARRSRADCRPGRGAAGRAQRRGIGAWRD